MKKKNLRKTTRTVLLVTFLFMVCSAFVHELLPKHLFMLLHVLPGLVFTVFTFIHMKQNNYPVRRVTAGKPAGQ